jgi:hypothetical protein
LLLLGAALGLALPASPRLRSAALSNAQRMYASFRDSGAAGKPRREAQEKDREKDRDRDKTQQQRPAARADRPADKAPDRAAPDPTPAPRPPEPAPPPREARAVDPEPPPEREKKPATYAIRLRSRPTGATVTSGGETLGTTPVEIRLRRATAHVLVFTRPGHKAVKRAIRASDSPRTLSVDLPRAPRRAR